MNLKICFDHQIFTEQKYGGVSRYYFELSKKLIEFGEDVSIFAGLYQNLYLKNLAKKYVNGYYCTRYPPKTGRIISAMNNKINEFKINKWQPDIIHQTYFSKSLKNDRKAARIVTAYDMIHEIFNTDLKTSEELLDRKKYAFSNADHIICISKNTQKDLINFYKVPEERSSIIHLGVDTDIFNLAQKKLPPLIKSPYLLYVGGRQKYKNFENFIKAFSLSIKLKKDFQLVLFGGNQLTSGELSLINEIGINNAKIEHIEGNDLLLANLYSHASAFIYPSFYEGFGLPLLEAMASGCPVICSNRSSIPEIVKSSGVYFEPESIENIKSSMEKVVFDDDLKFELIKKGLENVKFFTWEKCAMQTLLLYRNVGKI